MSRFLIRSDIRFDAAICLSIRACLPWLGCKPVGHQGLRSGARTLGSLMPECPRPTFPLTPPRIPPTLGPMPAPTLLLIPAFHEAPRVGAVVAEARAAALAAGLDLDIAVIDDGSSDGTAAEARAAGAIVISHPFNLGYGSALHTGYHFARRRGYRQVLQMDADGQHEAACLPRLAEALDRGFDVALGSRYLGGLPPPASWSRRVGTRLFAAIATRWIGQPITDPTSGFQGLSARALAKVTHDGFPEDYPDTDVLIDYARAGLRLCEVPVRMHPRRGGLSMHRGARIVYYGYKMLVTLLLLAVRRETPFRRRDTVSART